MNDFKIIAKILAAIRASEMEPGFNIAYVSESALHTTEANRDNLALKLQKAGYIEGLYVVDDIDNVKVPVILWQNSKPSVTLKGLEYIQETKPLQKALKEIANMALETVAPTIMNAVVGFLA